LLDEIWPPAVAAVAMASILFVFDRTVARPTDHGVALGLALLVAEAVAGGVVFFALLVAIRPDRARELRGLLGLTVGRRGVEPVQRG
jgi:hypothetical protein